MSPDASSSTASDPHRRDLTLDLARVAAVVFVVVVHLLQVGVGHDTRGAIVTSRPAEAQPWFDVATWFGQIMPLFFVIGGFASGAGWASWVLRGGDAAGFIRSRTLRLVQPALVLFGVLSLVMIGVKFTGIDPGLVDAALSAAGMPLWFLAAYLICQALVPLASEAHRRMPRAFLVGMTTAVIAVDAVRFASGIEVLGYLNLLFVWPLIHQFGFWYHDGWFSRRRKATLVATAVASSLGFAGVLAWAPYSTNMLTNLNPPTLPLVLLGLAQTCVLCVIAPALALLMRTRIARLIVFAVGSRLMTVYLWHLPVILIVSAVALIVPGAAPPPGSADWWATRPLVFAIVVIVLGLLSVPLARIETIGVPPASTPPRPLAVAVAWISAFLPLFLVTVYGLDTTLLLCGTVSLAASVVLLRGRRATPHRAA